MRNIQPLGCIVLAAVLLCGATAFSDEAAEASDTLPLLVHLKGCDVQTIHAAAEHVMFKTLSLRMTRTDESEDAASRVDALTGRVDAVSADGIMFCFCVYYLDENSCQIRVHAFQTMGVPAVLPKAMLKKYCQLIYDKTVERLEKMKAQKQAPENVNADLMEFTGTYDLTIEAMFKVMSDTANSVGVGHSTRIRNRFSIEGALTSGLTQFSYKAYMIADNKLRFRLWKHPDNLGGMPEGERYIYETIRTEFQKQLKPAR